MNTTKKNILLKNPFARRRPFALFNGKRWGIIHPRTKRPQPPTEPRPPTNIGACTVDQIEEIILSSDEEIIVISDHDEEDD